MRKKIGALLGVLLVSSSFTAFAGSEYLDYSTTVGKFNGSGYTDYQTKVTTGAAAGLNSETVGGTYTVDVRMQDSAGNAGDWAQKVGDNDYRAIDGSPEHTSGKLVRLQFSNDLTTRVDVQVSGNWRSN